MGQIASELNPVGAVANSVRAICHDCSVFVFNAFKSDCNCCGCLVFAFQTFETHEDDSDSSIEPCCG